MYRVLPKDYGSMPSKRRNNGSMASKRRNIVPINLTRLKFSCTNNNNLPARLNGKIAFVYKVGITHFRF